MGTPSFLYTKPSSLGARIEVVAGNTDLSTGLLSTQHKYVYNAGFDAMMEISVRWLILGLDLVGLTPAAFDVTIAALSFAR